MLLAAGARLDDKDYWCGETPLYQAAINPNPEVLRSVLDAAGPCVNTLCFYGWNQSTALHGAVLHRNDEQAKMLLGAGACPNIQDGQGRTPLSLAVEKLSRQLLKALLDAGAEVEVVDQNGWTPLHWAAWQWNPDAWEFAEILLRAGACVNASDKKGRTPLHMAVSGMGDLCVTTVLVRAGANPLLKDSRGYTPRDCANWNCGSYRNIDFVLRGAEEDWTWTFILQVSAVGMELEFHTLAGSLAATLTWSSNRPAHELPKACLEVLRSSDFEAPKKLRESNLRFVLPNGDILDTSGSSSGLEQLFHLS